MHKKKSTKILLTIVIILLILALAAAGIFAWLVFHNIADSITVEAGAETVDPNAYKIRQWDFPVEFATDLTAIDLSRPRDYPVQLNYCRRVYDAVLSVRDTVSPGAVLVPVTAMSYEMPAPEDFIQEFQDVTAVTVQFEKEPDMTVAGEQKVSLLLTDESGNTATVEASLTVIIDTQPPVIEGAADFTFYIGQTPDYLKGVTISDDLDEAPALEVDDSKVDLTQEGTYDVTYIGRDATGNESSVTVTMTVIEDNEAPAIMGVNPISLYEGSTVAYRSGILVVDDKDENPVLTVDSTGVDLSKPGTYEVIYKATDAAGNEASFTTTVTVKEKSESYVEEQVILDAVDEILKDIITEDMTVREQVQKIYRWVKSNCSYINHSDKTDSLQAAYKMIKTRQGDCFSYYAVSKVMFDRLGIPNITVIRSKDSPRRTTHFWSMVSVDGGENYYHYDATPSGKVYRNNNFCLVTDEFIDGYNALAPGYYMRDQELYPRTPTE